MTDMIYYKNGEETFRISPPTVGTKCPETKLEVKKMTKPITLNLTLKELQQIDKYVEINDDTLSVIMKITNAYPQQKSPAEEAYKRWWGDYPPTTPSVSNFDDNMWSAFQKGYTSAKEDYKVGEYQPTPQEPEKEQQIKELVRESVKWCEEHPDESVEDYLTPKTPEKTEKLQEKDWDIKVETDYLTGKARHKTKIVDKDGNDYKPEPITIEELLKPKTPEKTEQLLREAFKKVQQTEEWKETQRKIDSNYDDMVKNPPSFLRFELGKTLEQLIERWWCDVFTTHEDWDMETAIDDLCDRVELWLPKSQSSSGSQNVDVEFLVDGFNDAIKKIKSKLRNKK